MNTDKTSEAPPSTREDLAGSGSGRMERPSLDKPAVQPLASNELDRGTNLDRPGVPLGSSSGGGNMGVDTSATDKLHSSQDKEKFGEIRIPKGKDVPRSKP